MVLQMIRFSTFVVAFGAAVWLDTSVSALMYFHLCQSFLVPKALKHCSLQPPKVATTIIDSADDGDDDEDAA